MTMNSHWGWNEADTQWKSTAELLHNLIDIASKGGNYLLNIGPRADGTFPPEAVERLAGIGAWMQANGEAISGTTASVFDTLPFGRCTVREGRDVSRLYLHVFDWPQAHELALPGLGNTVRRAFVLAHPDAPLAVRSADTAVHVQLPAAAPDPIATVVVVEVDGAPLVYRDPTLTAESDEFVTGLDVTASAGSPQLEVHYTLDGSEPGAGSPRALGPIHLGATTTLKAVVCHAGRTRSDVVSRTFTRVAPLPPADLLSQGPGLRLEQYAVDWQSIPDDRSTLSPVATSVAATVGFASSPGEHTALSYRGYVVAPRDELFRFALTSDDGSRLWIDGALVVDNDGLHGSAEKRGAIALAKGPHAIEVVWFNRTGGAELKLQWALPGEAFAPVPASALKH